MATNTDNGNAASSSQLAEEESQHVPATSITEAEKREVLILYAELFAKNMETMFQDQLTQVVATSARIKEQAQEGAYRNVNGVHHQYDMLSATSLAHSSYILHKVESKLSRFENARHGWWKQCLGLPTQEQRLNLVNAVVEAIVNCANETASDLWEKMASLVAAHGGPASVYTEEDLGKDFGPW